MENRNRRSFLEKSVLISAGLGAGSIPREWITPIVNSIILPTHAQMSASITLAPTQINFGVIPSNVADSYIESSFSVVYEPGVAIPRSELEISNSNFSLGFIQTSGNTRGYYIEFRCDEVGVETGEIIFSVYNDNNEIIQQFFISLRGECT